jgi:fatty acyl-CoA reductase
MLLQKSIFHKVRDQQQLLAKVCAVDGDITQPGLGLAPDTARQLQQELHIVLHCAADIRLEVSTHQDRDTANFQTLKHGSSGTCSYLKLHMSLCTRHMDEPKFLHVRCAYDCSNEAQ